MQLRSEIARHDELYYKKSAPEISDSAYDQLKRELATLEKTFPALANAGASSAEAFGDDRSGLFPLYRHREPMLSLGKCYTESELRAFRARIVNQLGRDDLQFVIEPKFDGLSISVTYEQGKLVRAVTRGNGIEGDDMTANVLTIATLPRTLRPVVVDGVEQAVPTLIELRGEIYLPFAEFQRINREREAVGETPFAHPRNLAAGTLKQLDPREVAQRKLAIVFYGWGACEPASTEPRSQQELHARIRAWGLPGVENCSTATTADELWAAVRTFDRARPQLTFPVDGVVIKLDAVSDWRALGATEHAPKWATAYKFSAERVETKLLAISIQVGRTGVLTPVAELAPVQVGGATVTRASLHTRREIARSDIRVGDFVYVEKAGEIIPAIVGVNTARRSVESVPFAFPIKCPSCQMAVNGRVDEALVRCVNPLCPEQLKRRLLHFASEECVDLEGFGPVTIDALIKTGRLVTVADFYRLKREDFARETTLPGKTADRLLAVIGRSKHAELWRFIYGLGIPEVGAVASRELAQQYCDLAALAEADAEDLAARNIGARTAAAVIAYFADSKRRELVDDLEKLGVEPSSPVSETTKPRHLTGKIFVLTGQLQNLSRAEATQKILAAGGKVAGSVSRRTSFIVAGEGSGAKLEAARSLGVSVIDERELRRLLENE